MSMQRIKERSISPNNSLLNALKSMDRNGIKSLLVIDDHNVFLGILSIGDIQRAIIRNESLNSMVIGVLRPNPRVLTEDAPLEQIKEIMLKYRMEFMPVISKSRSIVKVYFWEDLFFDQSLAPLMQFDLPVVIMAGGLGTRLKPFTNVLPKPLFPLGEKTVIEEIFVKFLRHGCKKFYISANYKADLLEYYIRNLILNCQIHYLREGTLLGTAGSLSLLKSELNGTFFVSNCDILIDQDYSEILNYHKENRNVITIVAALRHFPIPYGVLETGVNGLLDSLQEKPELILKINSGMYILEAGVLDEIPDNAFFHITQLIEKVHGKGGKIGVFPVSEGSWQDVGQWDEQWKR